MTKYIGIILVLFSVNSFAGIQTLDCKNSSGHYSQIIEITGDLEVKLDREEGDKPTNWKAYYNISGEINFYIPNLRANFDAKVSGVRTEFSCNDYIDLTVETQQNHIPKKIRLSFSDSCWTGESRIDSFITYCSLQ